MPRQLRIEYEGAIYHRGVAQVAHEFRYVDAASIFDTGESDGAKIFFGEKFETSLADPVEGE